MQTQSPSSRTLSISGGRSTKRRCGAIASDRAGREPGCRGGTTNCFQTVRIDRRRGCPPSCLIGAVHRAAASGISRPHARSPRPRVSVPHLRPGKNSRPRAGGSFRCTLRQSAGRPKDPKDPGRHVFHLLSSGSGPCSCSCYSSARRNHVRSLRGVGPRPNELHTPDGESPLEFGAVAIPTRETPPSLRRTGLLLLLLEVVAVSAIKTRLLAVAFVACRL